MASFDEIRWMCDIFEVECDIPYETDETDSDN